MSKTWKSQERKLAKLLDQWWGTDGEFRRTPMSGAWDKRKFGGDIVTPADCPFIFEMKTGEEWDFRQAMNSSPNPRNSLFTKAAQQVLADSRKCGRIPVLAFTRNRIPVYFGFPHPVWRTLVGSSKALKRIPALTVWNGSSNSSWTFWEVSSASMKESYLLRTALTPDLVRQVITQEYVESYLERIRG